MLPVQLCQHWKVTWLDSHTCHCRDCGKTGHWYEDGFVLWRRDERRTETPIKRRVNVQRLVKAG